MKILELRFKNLNSLYGEWLVDFSDDAYVANGIFALTGPTGAGKSTILDAICLGLYGATPRLGKITKSTNELMSRGTGECYAEVVFESQAGRFRCHWQQRRARKNPDGKLQEQEQQIADADTGKIIETKKRLVADAIEAKTGMDFERFTRSMLLAQGGFDTFLKADAEQKSKILEQITGTAIYSDISRRVHERHRDEQMVLQQLQAQMDGIVILDSDQRQAIEDALTNASRRVEDLEKTQEKCEQSLTWYAAIAKLQQECQQLEQDAEALQQRVAAFQPQRQQLQRADQAATLDGNYAELTTLRRQQQQDVEALKAEQAALPKCRAEVEHCLTKLNNAVAQVQQAKAEQQAAIPTLRAVRALDSRCAEQQKAVRASGEAQQRAATVLADDKTTRKKRQQQRTSAQKQRQDADAYLRTHAQDAWLVSGMTGIEAELKQLLESQKKLAKKQRRCQDAAKALAQTQQRQQQCAEQVKKHKDRLKKASQARQRGEATLDACLKGRLLREYRAEKEQLLREMAFLARIAALETHRAQLQAGQPCPLCGAVEHPFVADDVPDNGDADNGDTVESRIDALTALIAQAEQQELDNQQLKQAEATARQQLDDGEKQQITAVNAQETAVAVEGERQSDWRQHRDDFHALKQAILAKLQPLGIADIADDAVVSLVKTLKTRLSEWQKHTQATDAIDKKIDELTIEIERLDGVIETRTETLNHAVQQLNKQQATWDATMAERRALYADDDPNTEEKRLRLTVSRAETDEKSAAKRHNAAEQRLTAAETRTTSLQQSLARRGTVLETAEADFATARLAWHFDDETDYLNAVLSPDRRQTLRRDAEALDRAQTALSGQRQDRQTRLKTETAKQLTETPEATLQVQFEQTKTQLRTLRDELANHRQRLQADEDAKNRIKTQQAAAEAQRQISQTWNQLQSLIGSADGKKYRNFAQGLTFELMVAHANRQLQKMTDRYLLVRDPVQPLALNVIDNYQAGEVRSTQNLSGGESFIVSLTLALGLSQMAGRNIRVDSLFLDEGFGTLDEEALETALQTLAELHHDGKLIGVISHVGALKERIATQITVTPIAGGRSRLSGPGCRRLPD